MIVLSPVPYSKIICASTIGSHRLEIQAPILLPKVGFAWKFGFALAFCKSSEKHAILKNQGYIRGSADD